MADPIVVRYEPRGAARELFACKSGEVLLDGPAGTGKSVAALWRLHLACLKYPKIRCLIVRKTAVSLTSTTLVTFEEKVAGEAIHAGIVKWYGGSAREPASYRYRNGSRIVVGGMDKPEKVMSSEYDLVFCDEATELTVDDWEALGTRLRNGKLAWQQQIAACNPAHPTHWINQRAEAGQVHRLLSRHSDNPLYINSDGTPTPAGEGYLARLDKLTGVRHARLRLGQWVATEGLIYDEWDPALHVVDAFDVPAEWTRWWAVDFGYSNPFVCQWWAEDGDGRLYLYREIYRTGRTVDQHAAQIARLTMDNPVKITGQPWAGEWREPQPRAIICDHDAEGRATLEREIGLRTTAANKKVIDGIQAVKRRLVVAGDGKPRLMVMRGARVDRDTALSDAYLPTCTEEEVTSYIWQVDRHGQATEEPRKEHDHGQDAKRYLVAHRDLKARYNIRQL